MKNQLRKGTAVIMAFVMLVCLASCGNQIAQDGLWANADYLKNEEFGSGKCTVQVEVKAEGQSVTFTINTDKSTLGDALLEHDLIAGEDSEYGLYVKEVNGIFADYDADKSYWAFYKNGEYMNTGVDSTEISDGEHYELVYTK